MAGSSFDADGVRWAYDSTDPISWAAVCNSHMTGIDENDKLIAAFTKIVTAHGGDTGDFKLQWENSSVLPGTWLDVISASGLIRPHASAGALENGVPVGLDTSNCKTNNLDDSEQVEDESPMETGSLTCTQNDSIEAQYCIQMVSAVLGNQYALRMWDNAASGPAGGTLNITMASPPAGILDKIQGTSIVNVSDIQGVPKANIAKVQGQA